MLPMAASKRLRHFVDILGRLLFGESLCCLKSLVKFSLRCISVVYNITYDLKAKKKMVSIFYTGVYILQDKVNTFLVIKVSEHAKDVRMSA